MDKEGNQQPQYWMMQVGWIRFVRCAHKACVGQAYLFESAGGMGPMGGKARGTLTTSLGLASVRTGVPSAPFDCSTLCTITSPQAHLMRCSAFLYRLPVLHRRLLQSLLALCCRLRALSIMTAPTLLAPSTPPATRGSCSGTGTKWSAACLAR